MSLADLGWVFLRPVKLCLGSEFVNEIHFVPQGKVQLHATVVSEGVGSACVIVTRGIDLRRGVQGDEICSLTFNAAVKLNGRKRRFLKLMLLKMVRVSRQYHTMFYGN